MKVPYSLTEAELLCKEFQHLIGTRSASSDAVIDSVVITPFDQPSKQRFFLFYHLFDNDAQAALTHEYSGPLFDVMIVARTDEDELRYEDLNTWFCTNNVESEYSAGLLSDSENAPVYS